MAKVSDAAKIQSLAQELLYATGKKQEKNKVQVHWICNPIRLFLHQVLLAQHPCHMSFSGTFKMYEVRIKSPTLKCEKKQKLIDICCPNTLFYLHQLFSLVFIKIPLHLNTICKLDLLTLQKVPNRHYDCQETLADCQLSNFPVANNFERNLLLILPQNIYSYYRLWLCVWMWSETQYWTQNVTVLCGKTINQKREMELKATITVQWKV